MKKVLIISYFFSPSNFVGAERTKYWAKNLHLHNIYPIIVTRNWNENQKDLTSKVINNEYVFEQNKEQEVHYIPHHHSLRDKLASFPKLAFLQKILTLFQLIIGNFTTKFTPYQNIYKFTKQYLQDNPDVKIVIASGRPFNIFFVGHKLKKHFKNLIWIPDYRDEWTTHQNVGEQSKLNKLLFDFDKRNEIKWTSNADYFISVSDLWVKKIGEYINQKGILILNGYNEIQKNTFELRSENFVITYAGSVYNYQPIDIFINSICSVAEKNKKNIIVQFIGLDIMPDQLERVKSLIPKKNKSNFVFFPRMSYDLLQLEIQKSNLLLLTSYNNIKGCYPVKLFEYFSSLKPSLLCPSDHDVMEDFLIQTNSGYIVNTVNETVELINSLINNPSSIISKKDFNMEFGQKFSRAYQTKKLADFIKSL